MVHTSARIDTVEHIIRQRDFFRHTDHAPQSVQHARFVRQRDGAVNFTQHRRHDPSFRGTAEQPFDGMDTLAAKLQQAIALDVAQVLIRLVLSFAIRHAIDPRFLWFGKRLAIARLKALPA